MRASPVFLQGRITRAKGKHFLSPALIYLVLLVALGVVSLYLASGLLACSPTHQFLSSQIGWSKLSDSGEVETGLWIPLLREGQLCVGWLARQIEQDNLLSNGITSHMPAFQLEKNTILHFKLSKEPTFSTPRTISISTLGCTLESVDLILHSWDSRGHLEHSFLEVKAACSSDSRRRSYSIDLQGAPYSLWDSLEVRANAEIRLADVSVEYANPSQSLQVQVSNLSMMLCHSRNACLHVSAFLCTAEDT
jgi:hypothetical protein